MQDDIPAMKNNLPCKTLPATSLLFYWYKVLFCFFPDIEVKTSKTLSLSHTHTQEVSSQCGSVMYSLQNQQTQTPTELFKYSNVSGFRFPQAFVMHISEHPTSFWHSHWLFMLFLLLHENGGIKISRDKDIAVFHMVLGICPWCGHLVNINRPLPLNKGQCQSPPLFTSYWRLKWRCHSMSSKNSEVSLRSFQVDLSSKFLRKTSKSSPSKKQTNNPRTIFKIFKSSFQLVFQPELALLLTIYCISTRWGLVINKQTNKCPADCINYCF